MKKFICLVFSSLFVLTGCSKNSYFETVDAYEADAATEEETEIISATEVIFVQVAGAVRFPGVYELSGDSRVFQAIDAAGGILPEADDSDINLALSLSDGEKIYVYTKEERIRMAKEAEAAESEEEPDDGLLNINKASVEDFEALPGIGKTKANQIVNYRDNNGPFSSIEEIKNVSGIGDGIYTQIQYIIKV